ncbi:MAG: helix-turn-helix transcriptional regulator [Methylobacteriaceae bacterium]|jgi:transcriptional regulator with XRE-family HTH domain|nr:helix-turn-helix transcriptional regulator [Methylobacteriaceae bacterium]
MPDKPIFSPADAVLHERIRSCLGLPPSQSLPDSYPKHQMVRMVRNVAGITVEQAAAIAGVDPVYWNAMEHGDRKISYALWQYFVLYLLGTFAHKKPRHIRPEQLKKLRNKYGLTQKQIKDVLFTSAESVLRWEKGRHNMPYQLFDLLEYKLANPQK